MNAPVTVPVDLGASRYDIVVGAGLLGQAGGRTAPVLNRPFTVVVTDETVARLHLDALSASLNDAGIVHETIILPAGEGAKQLSVLEALCAGLIEKGVERRDTVIAFGGGVIGDLAGFAAAVLHRGIGFVQIPTTLLAQVDSSVGGKTGVNLGAGKNLVGAFHQPKLVLADTDVLSTLPKRQFLAGYAEAIKYGVLGDRVFFGWLDEHLDAIRHRDPDALSEVVRRCCAAKAAIVGRDEREKGVRALLNLGHTFAHAFEACAGYDGRILHGEAVAVGMVLALELSAARGLAPPADAALLVDHLKRAGIPAHIGDLGVQFALPDVMAVMKRDKKVVGGQITFVLARGLGQAFTSRELSEDEIASFLSEQGVGPGERAAQ